MIHYPNFKRQSDIYFAWKLIKRNQFLLEQVTSMSSLIQVGDKKYTPAVIVRAFEYFVISRSLYKRLREDFELPSIPTLTRITSKLNSALGDEDYVKNIFKHWRMKDTKTVFYL